MDKLLQNVDLNEIINDSTMVKMPEENEELLGKISSFIDNVNSQSILRCDDECQKNKKSSELYEKYVNAQMNEQNAPGDLETAERNYYVYSKGDYAYNKMKENEYIKKGNKIANVLKRDFNDKFSELELLYNNVQQQNTYNKHIDELVENYSKNNKNLENDIENTLSDGNVSNRKSQYFNQYNNFVSSVSLIIYRLNVLLTVLFIILAYLGKKINERFYQIITLILCLNLFIPYKWLIQKIFIR